VSRISVIGVPSSILAVFPQKDCHPERTLSKAKGKSKACPEPAEGDPWLIFLASAELFSHGFIMMNLMANLTLIYGLRLLPEGEVTEIHDATLKLATGHEAHVTMHMIEGSREEIEKQLKRSLDAFFDFYPEI
jgi:hypothetical protein